MKVRDIDPQNVRDARAKIEQAMTDIRPHLVGLDRSHRSALIATLLADLLAPLVPAKRAEVTCLVMGLAGALMAEREGARERGKGDGDQQKTIQ
jgi:hypothetical protein